MRKYRVLLLPFVFASLQNAADFTTGQAARAVIGQYTFTMQNTVPSQQVVGAVGGLAYANGNLFVADSSPVGNTPEEFAVQIRRDIVKRAKLIQDAGIRAQ